MGSYAEELEERINILETELDSYEARVGSLKMLEEYIKDKMKWSDFCNTTGKTVCIEVLHYIKEVKEIKKLEREAKKLKRGRIVSNESRKLTHDADQKKFTLRIEYRVQVDY